MPIRPPSLDDRGYQDLVDELLARIPAHTPEWTDPRPGDPGRTLLELFAWLTDTALYRVNLIPERQRLAFLKLLGLGLRPPAAARGLVSLHQDPEASSTLTIRAGATLKAPVTFETLHSLQILPCEGRVYIKRGLTPAEHAELARQIDELTDLYELHGASPTPYRTTALFADGAVEGGVDIAQQAVDGCVWIALLAGKPTDIEAVRGALGGAGGARQAQLNVALSPPTEPEDAVDPLAGGAEVAPLPLVWEIARPPESVTGAPRYLRLSVLADRTRGATAPGVVELALPATRDIGCPENDPRVNIDAGTADRPPRLDDPEQASRLVTWVRLRPDGELNQMKLSWLGINGVEVDARQTLRRVLLGQGTGLANQELRLPGAPVELDTLEIWVEQEGRGYLSWRRVEALEQAGRDDAVFTADPETGVLRFGDGVRGVRPASGARVLAATARLGGGIEGNLPPGRVKSVATALDGAGAVVTTRLTVTQALPTWGGAAGETVEQAERRIPAFLRHRDRAITADDLVALAFETPGVTLGRAEVLRGFKPHQRRSGVPGVVSVMVIPDRAAMTAPNPRATAATLRGVHAWLAERVPLATELYVIGCAYVPVGVSLSVELSAGADRVVVFGAIREALARALWPLPPGGLVDPGPGWPAGKALRDRELEVVISRVPGVDEVRGVRLFRRDGAESWVAIAPRAADGVAQLDLEPWELPELLEVAPTEDSAAPSTLAGLPTSGGRSAGVAIPVVPEVC